VNHPFFSKTKKEEIQFQVKIVFIALLFFSIFLIIGWLTKIYFLPFLIFVIIITVIAPFLDVPSMKDQGKLIYYSNLLITEKPKNNIIKIHGGTLLDYFFVIKNEWTAKKRRNYILQKYIEGILNLITELESKKDLDITFRATTYIINARTATKIGFHVVDTDIIQKAILMFNYFNLTISNSIVKKKIAFPKLNHIITFEATLKDLIAKKPLLIEINKRLDASYI